ncbi:hypothetical protein ACFLYD_06505 [Chloroflexota bacterium]
MALQHLGRVDMDRLLREMEHWATGSPLEKRAAAAALCEPNLLSQEAQTERVLQVLDDITASVREASDRRGSDFKALRKGLGYCWSVAVAAHPEKGRPLMEKWFASPDRDVRWIMKQNLRKKRLERMDAVWVQSWQVQLAM